MKTCVLTDPILLWICQACRWLTEFCVTRRYIILAASAVPDGCTDAKVITDKVLASLPMEEDSYRLGNKKVLDT